jgi:hypothetical protein
MPEPGAPGGGKDVNVPGMGKVDRKWVLAGLAATAGIVVYAYWRASQAPIDEAPEEGDQYASGDDYTPDAYIGATQPGGETYDPNDTENNLPTTNAEWSQRVIDALESVGYDRANAAQTVGKYLAGQPLNAAEKLTIQVAIAMLGNPPAGALPIISAPAPPTTPPPATSNKLATPTMRYSAGSPANTNYALAWTAVPGAQAYLVKRERGPAPNPQFRIVKGTGYRTHALKRKWVYQYRVQAQAVGKLPSNWSNPVSFKVP